ncbi:MAG: hypothetical protein MUF29_03875, partial [Chitinophagaceae bacterium]|nr:hypothetical protein [Chitinophagaceae bacterium]
MKRLTFLQGSGMAMAMAMVSALSYAQKPVQVRLATGVELSLPAADAGKSLDRIQRQAAAGHYYWVGHTADREAFARAAGPAGSLQIEEKIGPATYLIRSRITPQAARLKAWGIDAADLLLPEHKLEAQ